MLPNLTPDLRGTKSGLATLPNPILSKLAHIAFDNLDRFPERMERTQSLPDSSGRLFLTGGQTNLYRVYLPEK